jgi:hypothetical protein
LEVYQVIQKHIRLFMVIAVMLVVFFVTSNGVEAQSVFAPEALAISVGAFNFDLSGTGTTPSLAVTADWAVTDHLLIEGGSVFAWPDQRIGRTTYIIPEAQLQYRWQLGRFMPFVGGGAGAALDFRDRLIGGTQTDLALSTGGGLRARLTESLGIRGEFRLRGLGRDFSGSASELRAGVFWSF